MKSETPRDFENKKLLTVSVREVANRLHADRYGDGTEHHAVHSCSCEIMARWFLGVAPKPKMYWPDGKGGNAWERTIPEEPQTEATPRRNIFIPRNWVEEAESKPTNSAAAQIATLTESVVKAQSIAIQRGNDLIELRAEIATLKAENEELKDALRELYDMVNYALDSRDALLISKTCATMDAARAALGE